MRQAGGQFAFQNCGMSVLIVKKGIAQEAPPHKDLWLCVCRPFPRHTRSGTMRLRRSKFQSILAFPYVCIIHLAIDPERRPCRAKTTHREDHEYYYHANLSWQSSLQPTSVLTVCKSLVSRMIFSGGGYGMVRKRTSRSMCRVLPSAWLEA